MHLKVLFFPYAFLCLAFILVMGIHFQQLMGLLSRNAAMVQVMRVYATASRQVNNEQIIALLARDVAVNPQRPLTRARLAGVLIETGNEEAAQRESKTYLPDESTVSPCQRNQPSLLRTITYLSVKTEIQQLFFAHPASQWVFTHSPDAVSEVKFIDESVSQRCIVQIIVDFTAFPQRYSTLYRTVRIQPDQLYQIRADSQASGIEIAWMGIASQWTGVSLPNSEQWRQTLFQFRTQPTQVTETIQVIVEAGHGTLKIHDVTLERIEP